MTDEELSEMDKRAEAVTGTGASAVWSDVRQLIHEVRRLQALTAELRAEFGTITANERERCANVALAYEPHCDTCPRGVVSAILGRPKE